LFSDSTINEIRGRIDIIDLISDYTPLKRAGRNFKALCPFHQEKTASFIVNPEKQIFYCFGCHAGGDAFAFLMKIDGLTFPEALEKLGAKVGVKLQASAEARVSSDEKETLYQANRVAAWHYHENLKKSPAAEKARAYLRQRGLGEAEVEKFRLGYVLSHSDALPALYQERKVPLDAALKVGVLKQGERGYYETFRGRVIFPIFNRDQKVAGLGGRILDDSADQAKYINSSDSAVYDKSSQLYGLPLAKEAIRKKNRSFVVEGYLDVIALHQYGFDETVAPLGTALTSKQIALLKRYSHEIIVLFDGDDAGWNAARRSLISFFEQDISPLVLLLPAGEDPDTFLRKNGARAFTEKLKEVRNLFEVIIDKTLAQNGRSIAGKAASIEALKPFLLKILSPLKRNLYLRKVAQGLDVPEAWVFEELGLKPQAAGVIHAPSRNRQASDFKPKTEETLMEIFLKYPEVRAGIIDKISPNEFISEEARFLADFLWSLEEILSLSTVEILSKTREAPLQSALSKFVLAENPIGVDEAPQMANDCLLKMKRDAFKRRLGDLTEEIRTAESSRQDEVVSALKKRQQELLSEMDPRFVK